MAELKLKFARELLKEAKRLGINDARVDRTKDHQLLIGTFDGKPIRMVFSGASSAPNVKVRCFTALKRLAAEKT